MGGEGEGGRRRLEHLKMFSGTSFSETLITTQNINFLSNNFHNVRTTHLKNH